MKRNFSADEAVDAAQAFANALVNPAPAGPFFQFGDAQLQAIKDLPRIFATAIVSNSFVETHPIKPVAPTYMCTTSTAISPQPSSRVTTQPAFNSGVATPLPSPTVTAPVVPRPVLIEPNNGQPVTPWYPLQSRRQRPSPAEQWCHHLIAACAEAATGLNPSSITDGTIHCFVTATCLLILAASQPSPEANSVMDKVTGKALEYCHLAR